MKTFKLISLFWLLTLALTVHAQDQKSVVISDSLLRRADAFPVKMGAAWMGRITKFKFGDYTVGESKLGWSVSTSKSAVFNRKTESSSKQKFYFELNGPTTDAVRINAVEKIQTEALREWVLFSYSTNHLQTSIDKEAELLLESNNFNAFLTINKDTTEVWSLIMTTFKGSMADERFKPVAILTNGTRTIDIVPVTSNQKGGDKRMFPACGYELMEKGIGLAATQFYGGGTMGMNKSIIWLPRDVEPKMKLLLAGVLTTILQNKVGKMDFN